MLLRTLTSMSHVLVLAAAAALFYAIGHSVPQPKEVVPGPTAAEVKALLSGM